MKLALIFGCLALALVANAQGPAATSDTWLLSQWQRKVWQIEDGLPHNYVTAVTRDRTGRLMVGTKSGIVTFDGFKFAEYPALRDVWITGLLQMPDGTLWATAHEDGLYKVADGRTTKIADGSFIAINQGSDGRVWAVSLQGAGVVEGDRFSVAMRGADTGVYGWQPTAAAEDGGMWFAAQEGLLHYDGARSTTVALRGVKGLSVTIYAAGSGRNLLLGTTTGLYRLACTPAACAGTAVPGVRGPVVGLHVAFDRSLWIATWGNGLYRMSQAGSESRVENLDSRNGLADEFVRALYEDDEHNMWVGTRGGGLTRFRTTILKPFGIAEGVDGNCASAAIGDGDGGVWLGTWRSGLFHWAGGTMTPQALPGDRLGLLVTTMALDASHNLWVGSFAGAWVLRHGERTARALSGELEHARIRQIFFARDRSLWIVRTNGQVLMYRSGDPATSRAEVVHTFEPVLTLAQDAQGTMWLGTGTGVWRLSGDGGKMERVMASASPALSISEDKAHRLWTTYDDGSIKVLRDGVVTTVSSAGLPNKAVYKVMEDSEANFWFSTGLGLAWASGTDVEIALKRPGAEIAAVGLGVAEGARTIECRCAKEPQAWQSPNGRMWIPTSKGFVQADPRRVGRLTGPPALIEEVRWDGSAVIAGGTAKVPAGSHNLEVHFTAVRLGTSDELRFRYRLEGVDDRWIMADKNRVARYAVAPPGNHRFLVSARDAIGEWGPPAETWIDQRPFLYQTLWFECLMIALVPLLMTVLYVLRLRGLRQRYGAVLEERGRIAREWHDTLLAGLAAIAWQLDGAIRVCREPGLATSLKHARSMLRYCSEEARLAVEGLRKESIDAPSLGHTMEETLHTLTADTDVKYEVRVDPAMPALPEQVRQALSRICQEAATNAIRHAQPAKIAVELTHDRGTATLSIHDDGVGIDPAYVHSSPAGHFGLLGMRERVQRIGGKLAITPGADGGTTVRVEVPISR